MELTQFWLPILLSAVFVILGEFHHLDGPAVPQGGHQSPARRKGADRTAGQPEHFARHVHVAQLRKWRESELTGVQGPHGRRAVGEYQSSSGANRILRPI